jgi:hypothetical protein
MPTSCAARCPDTVDGGGLDWLGLAFVAFAVGALLYGKWRSRHDPWFGAGHPLMLEAHRKALSSIHLLRTALESSRAPALVKFRLDSDTGESELVWAELRTLGATEFTARLAHGPSPSRGEQDDTVTLPLARLLDWQVSQDGGTIHGGFTRQVEIRLRRQAGKRLPEELAALRGRFVDR